MFNVTDAYTKAMRLPLRNRSYIRINLGLVNSEAMANATVSSDSLAPFADNNVIGATTSPVFYATNENRFTRVDGSSRIKPSASNLYIYKSGITSATPLSGRYAIRINFNVLPTDLFGLSIDFGDNDVYPTKFTVASDSGDVLEASADGATFKTEHVFHDTSSLTIAVLEMSRPRTRLRINSITLGVGLQYTNKDVTSSKLTSYVSPISMDVPQIDLSVTLTNYDQYFNVNNPDSALNYLETGQDISVFYGYDVTGNGDIEWVKGGMLQCSSWKADNKSATIKAQDCLRNMDATYYAGVAADTTYYDLAERVLRTTDYDFTIDEHLKSLHTSNPIPAVKQKEALQLIANACRCMLSQDRDGRVVLRSNYMPDYSYSASSGTAWSDVTHLAEKTVKDEYASNTVRYATVDGSMFFKPTADDYLINAGYVSGEESDRAGIFDEPPVVTIDLETNIVNYGLTILFGSSTVKDMDIRAYNGGELVDTVRVRDNTEHEFKLRHTFPLFDCMEFEFLATTEPFNRVTISYIDIENPVALDFIKRDITKNTTATKLEAVKTVRVAYHNYLNTTSDISTLQSDDSIELTAGVPITYVFSKAVYGVKMYVADKEVIPDAVSAYAVAYTPTESKTASVRVDGYEYVVTTNYVHVDICNRGKTITWDNPLIDSKASAADVAEWLASYYAAPVEYAFKTRGNPELDPTDIVTQPDDFLGAAETMLIEHVVEFNGALKGSEKTRRL